GKIGDYSHKWWKELWNQALLAPVFLLFIWIILQLTSNLVPTNPDMNFAVALAGEGAVTIVIYFLLLLAFLVAALMAAKQLAGDAGSKFSEFGQKAIGSVAGGAGGWLGRQTVGRVGARVAESQWLRDQATKEGVGGRLAMLGLRTAEGTAKSSLDLRNAPGASTINEKILRPAGVGIDMGKGAAGGGFRKMEDQIIKDRIKSRQDEAKLLEFKETKKEEAERKEGGDTRSAKAITQERQRAYAENITPLYTTTPVGPFTASRISTANFRADLEAAGKITKGIQDESKVQTALDDERKALRLALGLAENASDEAVTPSLIENKLNTLEKAVGEAKARAATPPSNASITEIGRRYAEEQRAIRKLNEFKELQKEIEKLEEKLEKVKDKNKGDGGGDKKDDKKEEKKES
ncbi:hypothetical protein KW797_04670, partial [Candidatus Parcubacteria bacterium]|nr:hypothetical protein [Candidatus Parcubacteria bacterium]